VDNVLSQMLRKNDRVSFQF